MPFDGLQVLSLESRRAAEIELLIRKQGGEPFVAPSVRERALDDHADAFRLLEKIEQGAFEMLILMTGVGLSFWQNVIGATYAATRADDALRRVKLLARGPKPVAVLRASGITPDVTVPEPNTWREIVHVLAKRPERKLAIQEYGRPNAELVAGLQALGADVETFALYQWELPEDTRPLREAIRRIAAREADVVLFTSSVQLDHLLTVAADSGERDSVRQALREHTAIASIGPVMSEALAAAGLAADLEATPPKMGTLVYAAAERSAQVIQAKRRAQ